MAPVKVKLVILLLTAVSSDALSPLAPVRAAKRVFLRRGGAAPTLPISSQAVAAAQRAWGDGIVEIGRLYTAKGDYKAEAVKVLGELYGWGSDLDVLFKPTKAADKAIRLTEAEAACLAEGCAGMAKSSWLTDGDYRFVHKSDPNDAYNGCLLYTSPSPRDRG